MATYRVGALAELPPGSVRVLSLGKRSVGVFNVRGTFHALNNHCPHQGGPLCSGSVTGVAVADEPYEFTWAHDGEIVRCPWHRWEVNITTGEVLTSPDLRVKKYAVTVENGEVLLEA